MKGEYRHNAFTYANAIKANKIGYPGSLKKAIKKKKNSQFSL